jgi:hypothetical protein
MSSASRSAELGYRVPARFSISEILAMMTVFALLFGALRYFEAPTWLYTFLGTQGMVICLVQMRFGDVPRGASTAVGCVFLPVWMAVASVFTPAEFAIPLSDVMKQLPFTVPFGGLLGYCTGTMAAGVFLIVDKLAPDPTPRLD